MSDIYSLIKTVLVLISVWMALLFITPGVARASDLNEKMIDAAYEGDLKAVETALTNGADVNSGEGPHGRTALMCAAWMGHGKIAALLIK
jgi:ankyrin repeat protein